MKRDGPYLQHIIDAIDSIREYTRDGRDAFMRDTKTQGNSSPVCNASGREIVSISENSDLRPGLARGMSRAWTPAYTPTNAFANS